MKAQKWLDSHYPLNPWLPELKNRGKIMPDYYLEKRKKRSEITELYIHYEKLEGDLIVKDWPNLEKICCCDIQLTSLILISCPKLVRIDIWTPRYDGKLANLTITNCPKIKELKVSGNQLTSLDLNNCEELIELDCSGNQLTNLILSNQGKNLIKLNVSSNKFTDLSIFSHLMNCQEINLVDNTLSSNLEVLKDLKKLKVLSIASNVAASGLEYLPESLESIWCDDSQITRELKDYQKGWREYDYHAWRAAHSNLVKNAEQITELERILINLNLSLVNVDPFRIPESTQKVLPVFIFQTEEKVKELKKENENYYQAQIIQPPYGTPGSSKN